jgi:hypothetical protein
MRLTPYLRGPARELDNPMTRMVVACKGAQTGATQLFFIWIINRAMMDPGPTIAMYPSEDLARYNSSTRFMPIVEDSPIVREALLPTNTKIDWTNLQQRMRTCVVNWIGGNSPANISSRPARYVGGDEVSKLPPQSKDEADPVNLLTQRQKTFEHNSKAFFISTPTVVGDAIMRLYERGDQRKLHVKCPYCLGVQIIKWANVKFDSSKPIDEAADAAFYECESCKHAWTDRDKREAVTGGEWRPTAAPQDKGVVSFHIPSFLAPWVKWPALVRKFLRSKNNPIELQDFVNSELAEPFVQADSSIRPEILGAREADYEEGTKSPFDSPQFAQSFGKKRRLVFGGADVQKDELVVVFREFTEDGESALVWKGRVGTFAELDRLHDRFSVEGTCIDTRYRSEDVYAAMETYIGIWPAKGAGEFRVPGLWEMQSRNIDEGRKEARAGRVANVLIFDSNSLHSMLSERIHRGKYAPDWFLFQGASLDGVYVREMTAQMRMNGRWINPTKRDDHYWDAEALCILAAEMKGYKPRHLSANEDDEKKDVAE